MAPAALVTRLKASCPPVLVAPQSVLQHLLKSFPPLWTSDTQNKGRFTQCLRDKSQFQRCRSQTEMIATGRDVFHARGGHIDALEVSVKACSFLKCLRLCFSKPQDYQVRYLSPRLLKWLPACVPSLPRPGVRDHFSVSSTGFPHSPTFRICLLFLYTKVRSPQFGSQAFARRSLSDPGSPSVSFQRQPGARLCPGSQSAWSPFTIPPPFLSVSPVAVRLPRIRARVGSHLSPEALPASPPSPFCTPSLHPACTASAARSSPLTVLSRLVETNEHEL